MPIWSPAFFGSAAGSSGYVIEDSIWLDGSADYLSDSSWGTHSDSTKFSFSCWIKRNSLGKTNIVSSGPDVSNQTIMQFDANDKLDFQLYVNPNIGRLTSTAQFRDLTAWTNFVFVHDSGNGTANDKMRIYVNGVRITALDTNTTPSGNYNKMTVNSANTVIGYDLISTADAMDGYLADVVFLDGVASTDASEFGETDEDTGIWVPKDPSGLTFGTNGFHLDFKVAPGTGNGAGTDVSGNGNHFAENSMTAVQQVSDSPTNDSDNSIGNYCTWNPLDFASNNGVFSEGNTVRVQASGGGGTRSTIAATSGRYYIEVELTAWSSGSTTIGIRPINQSSSSYWGIAIDTSSGDTLLDNVVQNNGSALSQGNIIGFDCDFDNDQVSIYINNSIRGSAITFTSGTRPSDGLPHSLCVSDSGNTLTVTLQATPETWTYSAKGSGVALNTANLAAPTVNDPSAYFQNKTYTGNGSTNALTFNGNSDMQPDLVWIKCRSNSRSHVVVDSVRGGASYIHTDSDSAQSTADPNNLVTAFGSDGFTLGDISNANADTETFVAWCMKAGGAPTATNSVSPSDGATMTSGSVFKGGSAHSFTPHNDATIFPEKMSIASHNGFSIVYYEGNATAGAKVPHGLDAAPDMIIMKNFSDTGPGWYVYHASVGTSNYLRLEGDAAQTSESNYVWNGTAPDANLFTLGGGSSYVNDSGKNHIAYCFKRTSGLIGIGKYTGNGSADGPAVIVDDGASGFKPAWFMSKQITDAGYNWQIVDAARDPENPLGYNASANLNGTDGDGSGTYMDFTSNSVKIRTSSPQWNADGKVYIYLSFAASVFSSNNRAR